jgi:hypothetical protein
MRTCAFRLWALFARLIMQILRDLTDAIYDFENLVGNTDNRDHLNDCLTDILEDAGDYFYSDARLIRSGVVEDTQRRAKGLGARNFHGQVTILIRDEFDEDGEMIPRRVIVPVPN